MAVGQGADVEAPKGDSPKNTTDIFEVDEGRRQTEREEEAEVAKRSKWTKQKFTFYNVEYIFLSILTYIFFFMVFLYIVNVTVRERAGRDGTQTYFGKIQWSERYHELIHDDIINETIFGDRFLDFWPRVIFALIFLPLFYLEMRKTIATIKDPYRVCWHCLLTRNAFLNYIVWVWAYFVGGWMYNWDGVYQYLAMPFIQGFTWGFHDCFKYILPLKFPGVYLNFLDDITDTATYYEFMKVAPGGQYGAGIDLGFNLYDCGLPTEDFTRTPREAQLAKYNWAFEKLHLKEGYKLMDIGCGCGDWLWWLKNEKKMKVVGLNVTKGQADVVEDRGVPCLRGSWQSFLKKVETGDREFIALYGGKFDCVTCWDTIEHYVKGRDVYYAKVQRETYRNLYKLAHFLLNKKSPCGMFWSSTLHQSRWLCQNPLKWQFWLEWGNVYLMNITYNGCYPTDIVDELNTKKDKKNYDELCKGLKERAEPQFTLEYEEDKIEDYRQTSIINPTHFGNFVMSWNLRLLATCFVHLICDPHFFLRFYNSAFRRESAWMWHVGGIEKDIAPDCPTKLLWQAFRFNPDVESFAEPEDKSFKLEEDNKAEEKKDEEAPESREFKTVATEDVKVETA